MSDFIASGVIIQIGEIIQVNETFTKREFVLQTDEVYPQFLTFQLLKDNCKKLDKSQAGDQITVKYNLKGKKWQKDGEDRFFNSLEAWYIENGNKSGKEYAEAEMRAGREDELNKNNQAGGIVGNFQEDAINSLQSEMEDDDLPF